MTARVLPAALLAASVLLFLSACDHSVQTTSGAEYLQRYEGQAAASGAGPMAYDIRQAANVEPTLEFPARIGLARLDKGELSAIPLAEAEAWMKTAQKLGSEFGEFVPVSPLVVALARNPKSYQDNRYRYDYTAQVARVVQDIRLGAARQHLDAVLIYEVTGSSTQSSNPLVLTQLVLIGFFLPSEHIEAKGVAQALLVDVRNGYSYGMASAETTDPKGTIASSVGSEEARASVLDEAKTAAAILLAGEVETMARELRTGLAEARLKRLTAEPR